MRGTGLGHHQPNPHTSPEEKLFLVLFLSCDWARQARWLYELRSGPASFALLQSKSPPSLLLQPLAALTPPAALTPACTHWRHPQAQRGKDKGIKIPLLNKRK